MSDYRDNLPARKDENSPPSTKGRTARRRETIKINFFATLKALLSLAPGGGPFSEMISAVEAHQHKREMQVLEDAVKLYGEDLKSVQDKLSNDEELAELWARGREATRTARTHEKIEAVATILAGSVDAEHDFRLSSNALLRILEEIDEEHFQILFAIEKEVQKLPHSKSEIPNGIPIPQLEAIVPHLQPIMAFLLNSLISFGLIENVGGTTWAGLAGAREYVLTDLGGRMVKFLHQAKGDRQ